MSAKLLTIYWRRPRAICFQWRGYYLWIGWSPYGLLRKRQTFEIEYSTCADCKPKRVTLFGYDRSDEEVERSIERMKMTIDSKSKDILR